MTPKSRFESSMQLLASAPQAAVFAPDAIEKWAQAREDWVGPGGNRKTNSDVAHEAHAATCFTPGEVGILVAEKRGLGRNPAMPGTADIIASKLLKGTIRHETETSRRNDVYRPLARDRFERDHQFSSAFVMAPQGAPTGSVPAWFDRRPVSDFYFKTLDQDRPAQLWLANFVAPERPDELAIEQICHLHMNAMKVGLGVIEVDGYENDRLPDRMLVVSWNARRAVLTEHEVAFSTAILQECADVGDHYWNEYVMQGREFTFSKRTNVFLSAAAPAIRANLEVAAAEVASLRRAGSFVLALAEKKQQGIEDTLRRFEVTPNAVQPLLDGAATLTTGDPIYDYTRLYQLLTPAHQAACKTTIGYDSHALATIVRELGASPDAAANTAIDPGRIVAAALLQGIEIDQFVLEVPVRVNFAGRERGAALTALQELDASVERIFGNATSELVADLAPSPISAVMDGPTL